jgi:hypothetical protein
MLDRRVRDMDKERGEAVGRIAGVGFSYKE